MAANTLPVSYYNAVAGDFDLVRFDPDSGKKGIVVSSTVDLPEIQADVNALSGNVLNFQPNGGAGEVRWPGLKNFTRNKALTLLYRFRADFNGSPGGTGGNFFFTWFYRNTARIDLHFSGPGLPVAIINKPPTDFAVAAAGSENINLNLNQFYDLLITMEGLDGTDMDWNFDGALFDAITLTADVGWDLPDGLLAYMGFGTGDKNRGLGPLDEMAMWDTKKALTDELIFNDLSVGTFADLTGSTRTKLILAPPQAILQAADLRKDVVVGSVTGLFDDPVPNDVRKNIIWDNGSKSGNIVLPLTNQVQDQVPFDIASVGTREDTFIVGTANGEVVDNIAEGEVI